MNPHATSTSYQMQLQDPILFGEEEEDESTLYYDEDRFSYRPPYEYGYDSPYTLGESSSPAPRSSPTPAPTSLRARAQAHSTAGAGSKSRPDVDVERPAKRPREHEKQMTLDGLLTQKKKFVGERTKTQSSARRVPTVPLRLTPTRSSPALDHRVRTRGHERDQNENRRIPDAYKTIPDDKDESWSTITSRSAKKGKGKPAIGIGREWVILSFRYLSPLRS
ncbi:hypothetical protein K435DRAFT_101866 [Dendrothele bispora CBS 962.96]|uniref:Uncharacterized protein n=1 Tax=Dendrothele bispora (strain CBS 962.96) TaxID=1314807 RepID=A0A4S8M290_DENBC|nr:hypothetical protein K435DRAFT_101866 [Dendrothele bispora CBS 962.96]